MPVKVSIVEDLAEVREGLAELVSSDKELLMIEHFDNAESAIEKLPGLAPDIVIMDINLPGMSGIECIKAVKEKCPGTQFMMFTVYETDEKVIQALQAGATGYLLKRTGPQRILESIKELSQGGSPMNSNIARKLVNIFFQEKSRTKRKFFPTGKMKCCNYWQMAYYIKKLQNDFISVTVLSGSISTIFTKSFMFRTGLKR